MTDVKTFASSKIFVYVRGIVVNVSTFSGFNCMELVHFVDVIIKTWNRQTQMQYTGNSVQSKVKSSQSLFIDHI